MNENDTARASFELYPEYLFSRAAPILFDEWQVARELWNRVRRAVDAAERRRGLYLLTGSATPKDDATRHSGARPFGVLRMRPMSLFESGHSAGVVSPGALLAGESQPGVDNGRTVPELMERVVIGGWPDHLDALERLQLLDNSAAWQPHMRSRARLRTAATRYVVDPSIGTAALGVGSSELLSDLEAAGNYFEALVIRDLRIYAQRQGGRVDTWRDADGNEVDAVVTLAGGRWAAIEIKMSQRQVDKAAAGLLNFAQRIDTSKHGQPDALIVVTATGSAGLRADGVHVTPVTALAP